MKTDVCRWNPAEFCFALILFTASVFLLLQIDEQVKYANGQAFYKQPGLWTGLGLAGMVIMSALYSLKLWMQRNQLEHSEHTLGHELWTWLRSLEFLAWFMGYVLLVPYSGYLLATLLFSIVLSLRLGYRSRPIYFAATLTAITIVVLFKSLLQVKIPGGALYEYLPDALRSFFIIYL